MKNKFICGRDNFWPLSLMSLNPALLRMEKKKLKNKKFVSFFEEGGKITSLSELRIILFC